MPKATSCKRFGQIIGVDEALRLRDEARRRRRAYPPFRCRECDEFVRPHKKGTTDQAAHFEHRESSPGCPLGAQRRYSRQVDVKRPSDCRPSALEFASTR